MKIKTFIFNGFEENTYVVYDETGECVVIDPGCFDDGEKKQLSGFIEQNTLRPVRLLNTHCHIDHVFGNRYVCDRYKIGIWLHENDLPVLHYYPDVARMYSISGAESSPEPEGFLNDGNVIAFGNSRLKALFTPGHSPGHLVFVAEEEKFIIGGDVLFYASIGRTDLPGGDYDTLIRSIREKLFPLGDEFQVYPGHGQSTTIGFEKANNPFL